MIDQTISHYPALWDSASKRDSRKRNKILEKLGEGGMRNKDAFQRWDNVKKAEIDEMGIQIHTLL